MSWHGGGSGAARGGGMPSATRSPACARIWNTEVTMSTPSWSFSLRAWSVIVKAIWFQST